jgi:methylated-DNA-protein-cysteine methyltransferase-like protein
MEKSLKQKIIDLVNLIPEGKVAYFGLIGKKLGVSGQVVGWILSGMKVDEWSSLPWHRVVAKNGFISSKKLGQKGLIQEEVLKNEGYEIKENSVNMQKHCVPEDFFECKI